MAKPNPFEGLAPDAPVHGAIEDLLADLYRCGEWEDRHEDLLDQWRAARGEAAKDHWRWWAGEVDADLYANDFDTRDEAIAWGRKEYAREAAFRIVAARACADDVKDGADEVALTDHRHHETIQGAQNDG